jgi:hypothetical protein
MQYRRVGQVGTEAAGDLPRPLAQLRRHRAARAVARDRPPRVRARAASTFSPSRRLTGVTSRRLSTDSCHAISSGVSRVLVVLMGSPLNAKSRRARCVHTGPAASARYNEEGCFVHAKHGSNLLLGPDRHNRPGLIPTTSREEDKGAGSTHPGGGLRRDSRTPGEPLPAPNDQDAACLVFLPHAETRGAGPAHLPRMDHRRFP